MDLNGIEFEDDRSRVALVHAIETQDKGYLIEWIMRYCTDDNTRAAIDAFFEE
jgi:hypothetical protein